MGCKYCDIEGKCTIFEGCIEMSGVDEDGNCICQDDEDPKQLCEDYESND